MPGAAGDVLWLLLALLAGALIAVQGPVYTRMAAELGSPVQGAWLAFVLASALLSGLLLLGGDGLPSPKGIAALPAWAWPGAVLGVGVVLISVSVIPRTGVSTYIVWAIAGQVLVGWLIDRSGAFGMAVRAFSPINIAGLILVIAGVALVRFR